MARDVNKAVAARPKEETQMTDTTVRTLTETELRSTGGGSFQDFYTGFNYALTVGCFISANPFVCGGALITQGFGLYAF
jgi:hypothetical protein